MKENYELLGLDESASLEEIEARYNELKAKYNEERWLDGEVGNNAARMLTKLDAAYREIMDEHRERGLAVAENGASAFDDVAAAIRSGDLSRAQHLLDDFNERNAEWHYLQSVVFYKKNWMNESKKQLEIAMQMDGANEKYRTAYEKLRARAEYTQQTGGAQHTDPDISSSDDQMGGSWCNSCASMCYTFLCVNALCTCCRFM